ncbi:hypothetical protein [Methylomonas methanica]|uniref:Uncharacterized protein n=1 Tax=Methylomonas methanica TaxID=421 RepID=A0A177LYR5_METMH|nr:hypothetical protein [Methylomonas methanica]OAH98617.1 hypothetical protein A1332_20180 [Methylomonas methanica]
MQLVIQCLSEWLRDNPSDTKAHRILSAMAKESLIRQSDTEVIRYLESLDITEALNEKMRNVSEATEWIDWNRTVLRYWKSRENQIIEFARKCGLDTYPYPERISSLGGPDKTNYVIKTKPIPNIDDDTSNQNKEPDKSKLSDFDSNIIVYEIAENGDVEPAWIVKWLLRNGQIRLSSRRMLILITFLLLIGGIAVIIALLDWIILTIPKPITTRELTAFLSVFLIPYSAWLFVIKPWFDLFDRRIVKASELLVSMNEKSAQIELFRDGDLRMIRLVRYTAPCPICGSTIHLDKGEPDYLHRLVGRCYESPMEHVFSFDRVTRRGITLRGSELKL